MDDAYVDARLVPTESFLLWDGAVEVMCFGAATGNWALRGMTRAENDAFNPGVAERLSDLVDAHRINRMYVPSPGRFNSLLAQPEDMKVRWPRARIFRGAYVEGVGMQKVGEAVGIASSDCPTIIVRNARSLLTVSAHAGRDSLYDLAELYSGNPVKDFPSVVDAIMHALAPGGRDAEAIQVFVACGIGAWWFGHRWDDPVHGERNRRLCEHFDAKWGPKCARSGFIDLGEIIAAQFRSHGVSESRISHQSVCTYYDKDANRAPRWHSHRRDGQGGRNFVLAIRRK